MAITALMDQYYLVFFFFFLLICLISSKLYQQIFGKPSSHLNLPPSPPALPIIGHLHLLTPALYNSFSNLSSKYGPLLYLRLGATRCLLVSSASMASEVFKTHDLAFSARPMFDFADKLLYGTSGFVTAPYGDYWRFMKKLCVTELLGGRQLERSRTIRHQELRRFLAKVVEKASRNEVLDVGGELMRLTNNVTCRMVMSTRCSGDDGEAEMCRKMVKESFELAAKLCFGDVLGPLKKLGFWIYGKQALNLSKRYDELLERVLKEHEERAERDGDREDEDLMDILLKVYKDDKKSEVKFTRTHIKAFFLDLFIAGTDTTAEAMQWTIAELLNHPDAFKKVREEVESVVGRSRLVEESDIPSLPYLQAVAKEALRMYPPAPVITRECRENCVIKGFDIPEKTAVAINLYAIMRDPDAWESPDEFRPERFLIPSEDQEQKLFNFVPFGGGRRGCPGSMLASAVMNTVIAAMVQCLDWDVNGDNSDKVDMKPGSGMSMTMVKPLLCQPVLHFNPFAA